MDTFTRVNRTTPTTTYSVHIDSKLILILQITLSTAVFFIIVLLLDFIMRRRTNQRRRMDCSLRSNWHKFFPLEYDQNRRVSVMSPFREGFTDRSLKLSDLSELNDISEIDDLSELSSDISPSLHSVNLSEYADCLSTNLVK